MLEAINVCRQHAGNFLGPTRSPQLDDLTSFGLQAVVIGLLLLLPLLEDRWPAVGAYRLRRPSVWDDMPPRATRQPPRTAAPSVAQSNLAWQRADRSPREIPIDVARSRKLIAAARYRLRADRAAASEGRAYAPGTGVWDHSAIRSESRYPLRYASACPPMTRAIPHVDHAGGQPDSARRACLSATGESCADRARWFWSQ